MDLENTVDHLKREVSLLREKLTTAELKLASAERDVLKKAASRAVPFTPKRQTTMEWRPETLTSGKRGIKEMVDEVVEGKKRKVGGIPFNPEGLRGKGVVVGVKVGGVLWDVGIGGVAEGLKDQGFVISDGARWLVGVKERERRERMGRTSSTVVAFVRGEAEALRLVKRGLWLRGRWHPVQKFEAIQPIRKQSGWVWVGEMVDQLLKSEGSAMRRVEGLMEGVKARVGEMTVERNERLMGKGYVHWSGVLKRQEEAYGKRWVDAPGYEEWLKKKEEGKGGKEKEGVVFKSKVDVDESGLWFPSPGVIPPVPEVPSIAGGTSGIGGLGYRTKEEALRAAGIDPATFAGLFEDDEEGGSEEGSESDPKSSDEDDEEIE